MKIVVNELKAAGYEHTDTEYTLDELRELYPAHERSTVSGLIGLVDELASKLNSAIAALTAAHCATDGDHRASILEDAMNELAPLRPLEEQVK